MTQIQCAGEVVTAVSGEPVCQDMGGAPLAWTLTAPFGVDQLEPALASGAFAAGFVLVAMGWVIGRAFGVVLSMFK